MGTAKYLLGKLGQLFITLLLVLSLAFLLFRVWQPGDPVATWAKASGAHLNAEQLDQNRLLTLTSGFTIVEVPKLNVSI